MVESPATETIPDKRPLDDVMLAMDVVDTLRHRASVVERELSSEGRDRELLRRLREIYASQGIEVPDEVLAEGVAALKEDRFLYTPPKPGLAVSLARLYVDRAYWARRIGGLLALLASAWFAYYLLVSGPRDRLLREIPRQLETQAQAIIELALEDDVDREAQQLSADGQRALREGDTKAAKHAIAELQGLRAEIEREYELRIVTEGSTGVWRVPDANSTARNYYIIVEAISDDNEVLTLPITNEENNKTSEVNKWGLRVDETTFQRIAADKNDDGIIQGNRFGEKRRGRRTPDYRMPTPGGAITSWDD
jgi:hypothetical protein